MEFSQLGGYQPESIAVDYDRDPLDVIIMLAFQFGIENGIAMEQNVIRWLTRDNERFRKELGKPSLDELTAEDIDFSFLSETNPRE